MHLTDAIKNEWTLCAKNKMLQNHVIVLLCCLNCRKFTKYETCAELHRFRDASHSNFCGIKPFLKSSFRIKISNVKTTGNNNFKMVPDKMVTTTSTPVISDH